MQYYSLAAKLDHYFKVSTDAYSSVVQQRDSAPLREKKTTDVNMTNDPRMFYELEFIELDVSYVTADIFRSDCPKNFG